MSIVGIIVKIEWDRETERKRHPQMGLWVLEFKFLIIIAMNE